MLIEATRRGVALVAAAALAVSCAPSAARQAAASQSAASAEDEALAAMYRSWTEPAEPFRIAGQLHYVGSAGIGIFFIPTDEGHILIDGGLPENASMVAESIRALGYDPADIEILLNTHAHFDHSGGLAELKRMSGARLLASEGDRSALEGGFYLGSEDDDDLAAPPVAVDGIIEDGETVSLGGVVLTARLTPGHTRGCTSWQLQVEEAGRPLDVLIFCSASVAANRLANPPQYEAIVQDYRFTFDRTRDWRPDVFLANHAQFFDMAARRERQQAGDPLAFVDVEAFPAFIAATEADFDRRLAEVGLSAD